MADDNNVAGASSHDNGDGWADAIAVTSILAIVILTVVYWLSGFPS
jgi:hypothetical protein